MSDFKKETKDLERAGLCEDGSEVFHRSTKGGLHQMIKLRKNGRHIVLGQGNHRAVARVLANQMEKNVQWHESLFKSEDAEIIKQYQKNNQMVPESNTKNHIAQAVWHTKQQQGCDATDKLYHSLAALGHYEAAGLDHMKALQAINITMSKLHKSHTMDMPFDEDLLKLAYEKKTGNSFPTGEK
jgi:hypothetical protein